MAKSTKRTIKAKLISFIGQEGLKSVELVIFDEDYARLSYTTSAGVSKLFTYGSQFVENNMDVEFVTITDQWHAIFDVRSKDGHMPKLWIKKK